MSRNGSGTYSAPSNSWNPAVDATDIDSSDWMALLADLSSALTTSIASDGQTTCSALIPFAAGLSYPGGGKIDASGLAGFGMTPVNALDITQNQNNTSIIKILNNSGGTGAQAHVQVSNGTAIGDLYVNGTGFTPSGIDRVNGVVLKTAGAGGLTFSAGTIYGVGLFDISDAASGQVKFPASQNASADANTLDDFEKGSFSPSLATTGTGLQSVTYNAARYGKYVKIGPLVHVSGRIATNAVTVGAASGTVAIGNLPFTASPDSLQAISLGTVSAWGAHMPNAGDVVASTTIAQIYYRSAVDGATIALPLANIDTSSTGGNDISFAFSYIASA